MWCFTRTRTVSAASLCGIERTPCQTGFVTNTEHGLDARTYFVDNEGPVGRWPANICEQGSARSDLQDTLGKGTHANPRPLRRQGCWESGLSATSMDSREGLMLTLNAKARARHAASGVYTLLRILKPLKGLTWHGLQSHRLNAWRHLKKDMPYLLIRHVPFTRCSLWQHFSLDTDGRDDAFEYKLRGAAVDLALYAALGNHQSRPVLYVLHAPCGHDQFGGAAYIEQLDRRQMVNPVVRQMRACGWCLRSRTGLQGMSRYHTDS